MTSTAEIEEVGLVEGQGKCELVETGGGVKRVRLLLTIGLVGLVTVSASQVLGTSTALPLMEKALGHTRVFGWFFSGFALVGLVGISVVPIVERRYGIRRTLGLCASIFSVGLVFASLSQNAYELLAARAVQGLGTEPVIVVAYILAGRYFDGRAASKLFAILASAWVLPSLMVPGLAGWVAQNFSWRWDFVGLVPFVIVAQLVCQGAIKGASELLPDDHESKPYISSAASWNSRLLFLGGVLVSVLSLSLREGIVKYPVFVLSAVAVGMGLRGLVTKLAVQRPLRFYALLLQRAAIAIGCFGLEGFIPLIINASKGVTPALAGVAITAATILWTTGSWVQARYAGTVQLLVRLRVGWLIAVVGVVFTAVTALDSGLSFLWPAMFWGISNFGMGIIYPAISVEVLSLRGTETASVTSVMQMVDTSAVGFGTGLIGVILGAGTTVAGVGRSYVHLSHQSILFAVGVSAVAAFAALLSTFGSVVGL